MTVTLSLFAGAGAQFLDNSGNVLTGGLIYTYRAGTTTSLAVYTSSLGTSAHPNPIVLDASGRVPGGEIWLTTGYGYKFVLKDTNNVLIGTYDNIPSSAQPPITNDASSVYYEQGNSVTAGAFLVGTTYLITSVGTTNFTSIGATSNTVGVYFIATGVGSGTGTAQTARSTQARLQDTISVKDFGAVGNGTTNDTTSIQNALNYSSSANVFAPIGTYLTNALTVGQNNSSSPNTNFYGNLTGTVFTPASNNISVITVAGGNEWHNPQYLSNFKIDGGSKTGITALQLNQNNTQAAVRLENINVTNADVASFSLTSTQFGRFYNLLTAGPSGISSSVGFYLQVQSSGGGSNSNDFYGCTSIYNGIGVLIDGSPISPYGSPWATVANNFYNTQINGNTCGWAFFYSQANIYGGSPESNGGTSSTPTYVTAKGKTIPACTMYLDNSFINIYGWVFEEYGNPVASVLVKNSSVLSMTDVSGGPGTQNTGSSNVLVSCDASSVVNLNGLYQATGVVNGISKWPDTFYSPLYVAVTLFTELIGTPILSENTKFTPIISQQAPAFYTGGANPGTLSYVNDAQLGYCTQIVCTPYVNTCVNTLAIPTLSANSTVVISCIIKSNINCSMTAVFADGNGNRKAGVDGAINLIAGVPTRVVLSRNSYAAGTSGSFAFFNFDTTGPTIQIANVVVYEGLSASATTTKVISGIICNGWFNSGVTRDTSANIQSKTTSVNTINKFPGKQIWDTTNNRVLYAGGSADVSVWKDGANTTIYTPA